MVCHNGQDQIRYFDMFKPQGICERSLLLEGIPSILSVITDLAISSRHIGLAADHAYLSFSGEDRCQKNVYANNGIGHAKY